ncbi:MAG: hypothetical protein R2865_00890 [Deinococcales bacterium]
MWRASVINRRNGRDIVGAHQAVAECAVIAVPDNLKGHVPVGLVVLKDGAAIAEDALHTELNQMIRKTIFSLIVTSTNLNRAALAQDPFGENFAPYA